MPTEQGRLMGLAELLAALEQENADRDERGNFKIWGGSGLISGLGGEEVIVCDSHTYFANGERRSLLKLVGGARSTIIYGSD